MRKLRVYWGYSIKRGVFVTPIAQALFDGSKSDRDTK